MLIIFALYQIIFLLEKRQALSTLRDFEGLTIKIQDKGSKFVVIDTEVYDAKMKDQLENQLHYKKLDSDPSTGVVNVILQWGRKWLEKGQISEEIAQWVTNKNAKPGKAFGTIKTYKDGNPLRLITSCCGMAIENLSAFTEFCQASCPRLTILRQGHHPFITKDSRSEQNRSFPKGKSFSILGCCCHVSQY